MRKARAGKPLLQFIFFIQIASDMKRGVCNSYPSITVCMDSSIFSLTRQHGSPAYTGIHQPFDCKSPREFVKAFTSEVDCKSELDGYNAFVEFLSRQNRQIVLSTSCSKGDIKQTKLTLKTPRILSTGVERVQGCCLWMLRFEEVPELSDLTYNDLYPWQLHQLTSYLDNHKYCHPDLKTNCKIVGDSLYVYDFSKHEDHEKCMQFKRQRLNKENKPRPRIIYKKTLYF